MNYLKVNFIQKKGRNIGLKYFHKAKAKLAFDFNSTGDTPILLFLCCLSATGIIFIIFCDLLITV
jgi:hypothetical protein